MLNEPALNSSQLDVWLSRVKQKGKFKKAKNGGRASKRADKMMKEMLKSVVVEVWG